MSFFSIKNLNELPAHGLTLIVRHAARFPLITPADVFEAGLTDEGISHAKAFGQRLAETRILGRTFSSPIKRCVHTASLIRSGAGYTDKVVSHWWLFSPNLESRNGQESSITIKDEGPRGTRYSRRELQLVLSRMSIPAEQNVVNVYITHDSTVLTLLAHLLDIEEVVMADFPGYLQGIALIQGNNGPQLVYPQQFFAGQK